MCLVVQNTKKQMSMAQTRENYLQKKTLFGCSPKFETLCGRSFDSNIALADFLGVDKSAVSHGVIEARAKGKEFFNCGKRSIRILSSAPSATIFRNEQKDKGKEAIEESDEKCDNFPDMAFNFSHKHMKAMQVHTHMQAAALKLFPNDKFKLLDPDPQIRNSKVAIVQAGDCDRIKFDVAETWILHVFVPGYTLLSFIKNVEKQDLNAYESVSKTQFHHYTTYSDFNKLSNSTNSIVGHRRVFMDAEDMVKFLYMHDRKMLSAKGAKFLSDGTLITHDPSSRFEGKMPNLFESKILDEHHIKLLYKQPVINSPREPEKKKMKLVNDNTEASTQASFVEEVQETKTNASVQLAAHHLPHTTAQNRFISVCTDVMENVETNLKRSLLAESDTDTEMTKKKKSILASDSINNLTKILFAANQLIYSASQSQK
jgi:hypothetical protein